MQSGPQVIYLANDCLYAGIIAHEIGKQLSSLPIYWQQIF